VTIEPNGAGKGWVATVTVALNGQPRSFEGSGGKKGPAEEAAADAALLALLVC